MWQWLKDSWPPLLGIAVILIFFGILFVVFACEDAAASERMAEVGVVPGAVLETPNGRRVCVRSVSRMGVHLIVLTEEEE